MFSYPFLKVHIGIYKEIHMLWHLPSQEAITTINVLIDMYLQLYISSCDSLLLFLQKRDSVAHDFISDTLLIQNLCMYIKIVLIIGIKSKN